MRKKPDKATSPRPRLISAGPKMSIVQERMVEIVTLITPSQRPLAIEEYSALLCAATTVMCTSAGVEPTAENLSRILGRIVHELVPVVAQLVKECT